MSDPNDAAITPRRKLTERFYSLLQKCSQGFDNMSEGVAQGVKAEFTAVQKAMETVNHLAVENFVVEPYTVEVFTPEQAKAHAQAMIAVRERLAGEFRKTITEVAHNIHAPAVEKFSALRSTWSTVAEQLRAAGASGGASAAIYGGLETLGSVALSFGSLGLLASLLGGGLAQPVQAAPKPVRKPDPRLARYYEYLMRWFDHAAIILINNPRNRGMIKMPKSFDAWAAHPT